MICVGFGILLFFFFLNYAGTNIHTNEEVAIKLVSNFSFTVLVGKLRN